MRYDATTQRPTNQTLNALRRTPPMRSGANTNALQRKPPTRYAATPRRVISHPPRCLKAQPPRRVKLHAKRERALLLPPRQACMHPHRSCVGSRATGTRAQPLT
ncbi:hypothetical protein T484DRAFT_2962903 [Baffinella frigidus]|nr:hypothetical protein T484DRAFT_2962903 [Cryptophyta sp. CCMP2293]